MIGLDAQLYHDSPNPHLMHFNRDQEALGCNHLATSLILTYSSEKGNNIRTKCPNLFSIGAHGP